MRHLGHMNTWEHIPFVITNVIFLVKSSNTKVSTVHNVGSKLS